MAATGIEMAGGRMDCSRWTVLIVAVCGLGLFGSSARGDTVKFRVDVEVIRAFTGVPLGTTGSVFVEYESTLADQRTSEPFHPFFGLYGYPDSPGVKMLWDYGGENAAYNEQGAITIVDAPFPGNSDVYQVNSMAGIADTVGITKGAFAAFTFLSGAPMRLFDFDDVMIGGEALIPPSASFLDLAELNTGDLVFFGNSAFVGHTVTDIQLLDQSLDFAAAFTAGSAAALVQAIMTPAAAFGIAFDYQFDPAAVSGGGVLRVLLDGVQLGLINASNAGTTQSTVLTVSAASLLNQAALDLVFEYDGPTGSRMFLDNILAPGSDLLNGDFQTQTLAAWGTAGPGNVGALQSVGGGGGGSGGSGPSSVPLPGAAGMGLLMLAAIGALSRVRRGRP